MTDFHLRAMELAQESRDLRAARTCGATRDVDIGDLGTYSIVCNRSASERNPTCLGEHCYTDQIGRRTRWYGDDRAT